MTRPPGATARRIAQREDEAASADRIAHLIGLREDQADAALEDVAIAQAHAFACGFTQIRNVGRVYIFRAAKPVACRSCAGEIKPEELFTSLVYDVRLAVQFADCRVCRVFKLPKGVK